MEIPADEDRLIAALKAGDAAAFKELVIQYQDRVYNTVLGILKSSEDAEDIAQEVFIEIYQHIHQFEQKAKLSTWIYRISLTKAWEFIRYKKRKKRFASLISLWNGKEDGMIEAPDFHHPGVVMEEQEHARALFRAIAKLPENQQNAFILHKLEGLSYAEIGEVLQTSLSSVESLMHRAKMNLRKHLHDYYQQELK